MFSKHNKFYLNKLFSTSLVLSSIICLNFTSIIAKGGCDLTFKYGQPLSKELESLPVQISQFPASPESTLFEHQVYATPILPGSAYVDLMLSNAKRFSKANSNAIVLQDITIQDRVMLPVRPQDVPSRIALDIDPETLFTTTTFGDRKLNSFQTNITNLQGKLIAISAQGRFSRNAHFHNDLANDFGHSRELQDNHFYFDRFRLYEILNALGLNYGENFKLLDHGQADLTQNFVQASILLKNLEIENEFKDRASITPHILDASFHAVAGLIVGKFNPSVFSLDPSTQSTRISLNHVYVPMQFSEIVYKIDFKYTDFKELLVRARIIDSPTGDWNLSPPKRVIYDLDILTPDHKPVLQVRGGSLVMVTPLQISTR